MGFIEVQTKGPADFYKFLDMIYASGKRSMKEQAFTHFKGVVRNMQALTYPMGGKEAGSASIKRNDKGESTGTVDFAGGKKAGQIAIAAGVNNAFRTPTEAKQVFSGEALRRYFSNLASYKDESPEQAFAWYLSIRDKRMRVRKIKRPVTAANKAYVYKQLLKRQGYVCAGWNAAAQRFGLSTPKWISEWSTSRGNCNVKDGGDFYYITARCSTQHPNAKLLQTRADVAMQMQRNNMKRILTDLLKKQAKKPKGFIS
jgi:hypothetical protein